MILFSFSVVHAAFEKLGLDCASWPEPVYTDLLRSVCFCVDLLDYIRLDFALAYA